MTLCCICIERRAAPVKEGEGVPLCIACREDAARAGEARRAAGAVNPATHDSAAMLMRYAARLTIAQAPARELAAMQCPTTAH